MPAISRFPIAAIALCGTMALPSAALGEDEIVGKRGWQEVAFSEVQDCRVQILGNEKVVRIGGTGFHPGERMRLRITNSAVQSIDGAIKPVEYPVTIRSDGTWREFYIPLISNRSSGSVTVSLATANCDHVLGFDWQKPSL